MMVVNHQNEVFELVVINIFRLDVAEPMVLMII